MSEFDAPDIDVLNIDTGIPDLSDTPTDSLENVTDTPDVPDDDFYHAEHMSDEEVKRIDEMWDETIPTLNHIKQFHPASCPI